MSAEENRLLQFPGLLSARVSHLHTEFNVIKQFKTRAHWVQFYVKILVEKKASRCYVYLGICID